MNKVNRKKLECVECPMCSFESKRLTRLERHLFDEHGRDIQGVWVELNGPRYCRCGCGGKPRWLGWKRGYADFIVGHNAAIYNYQGVEKATEIVEKRKKTLLDSIAVGDYVPWSSGLTRESSEILAVAAKKRSVTVKRQFDEGERKQWNKDLNKEFDERLASLSARIKKDYESGHRVAWCKGLSKDTDSKVRDLSDKVSISLREISLKRRLNQYRELQVNNIRSKIEQGSTLKVIDGLRSRGEESLVIKVRCDNCGTKFYDSLRRLQNKKCYACQPVGLISVDEIVEYVSGLGLSVVKSSRVEGMDFDIFVPSHNFAIEYCGLYWHCDLHKSSMYHENKFKASRRAGINLLYVFEDDWRDRGDIVRSAISRQLNLIPESTCSNLRILELDRETRHKFFETNHIDGDVPAASAWGVFNDNEMIAGISIRRPFHKLHEDYLEVARYCAKIYTNPESVLKMLTRKALEIASKNSKLGIITYVDERINVICDYEDAGYLKIDETMPRFWWTDFERRFNRYKFKADPQRNLSESDVAAEAGVIKIWGCSNRVYCHRVTHD